MTKKVAYNLRWVIGFLNFTQREISKRLYFQKNPESKEDFSGRKYSDEPYISTIFNGKRRLSLDMAIKIGEVMKIDYRLLMDAPEYETDLSLNFMLAKRIWAGEIGYMTAQVEQKAKKNGTG